MEDKKTTIQIYMKTRDRLLKLGKKGESYDKLINRLLDECKK